MNDGWGATSPVRECMAVARGESGRNSGMGIHRTAWSVSVHQCFFDGAKIRFFVDLQLVYFQGEQ